MEGYVRLALLIIGAMIVVLVVFDSQFRKHKNKQPRQAEYDQIPLADADEILGLDRREPTITLEAPVKKAAPKVTPVATPMVAEFDSAPLPPLEPIAPIAIPNVYTESVFIEEEPLEDQHRTSEFIDKLLIISVVAKPNQHFASYDLLQSISATGMQFGDMNIFHYYVDTEEQGRIALFSLAAATEPGEFNLDNMGDFSCPGLTLFMSLSEVPDAEQAFELMLKTAEQLADDLHGELRAGLRIPWTDETLQHYQQKILECQALKNS